MSKFSEEWLNKLHCALWIVSGADVWTIHKVLYEASIRGLIETSEWVWFGNSPRSAEIDAALALFELSDIIHRESNAIKVSKPPADKCESHRLTLFIKESLSRTT